MNNQLNNEDSKAHRAASNPNVKDSRQMLKANWRWNFGTFDSFDVFLVNHLRIPKLHKSSLEEMTNLVVYAEFEIKAPAEIHNSWCRKKHIFAESEGSFNRVLKVQETVISDVCKRLKQSSIE